MDIKGKKIGIALTGSFCTFEKMFQELQKLKDAGADIYPIMSDASQTIESRFGNPDMYIAKIKEITEKEPIFLFLAQNQLAQKPISTRWQSYLAQETLPQNSQMVLQIHQY